MSELVTPGEWVTRAACARVDPEIFYPESAGGDGRTKWAKKICTGDNDKGIPACPVLAQCLDYSMVTREQYGIWGGMTPRERLNLRRELRLDDTEESEVAA